MRVQRVLFLDLATTSGWAADGPTGDRPVGGVLHFTADPLTKRTVESHAYDRLCDLVALTSPHVMAFERAVPIGGPKGSTIRTNHETVVRLISLIGVFNAVAGRFQMEVRRASAMTVRKHFCGDGRADKNAVMSRCRQLGWSPQSKDVGDAMAGWCWTKDTLRAGQVTPGPLFVPGEAESDFPPIPDFLRRTRAA